MKNTSVKTDDLHFVPLDVIESIKKYTISKDDLYITVAGTIGNVGKIPDELDGANLTENANKIVFSIINREWLLYTLQSPYLQGQISDVTTKVGQPKLAIIRIENLLLPLPPLEEQHKIVQRVESFIPHIARYTNLKSELDVINNTLCDLFKKSILQEAIQGKLVPQCSEDEPASALLQRIKAEKERLIQEKKIKRDKTESVIFRGDDNCYFEKLSDGTIRPIETPFSIPDSWEWVRLGDLVYNMSGLSYKKEDLEVKHDAPIRVLRGGNIGEGFWLTKDDDVRIAPQFVKSELLLKAGTFITPAVSSFEQVGKTGLIEADQENIVVGGFVLMLIPFSFDKSFLRYLLYVFQSPFYKAVCQSIVNKSGQAFYNLSRTKLMNASIPLPPLKEQCRIGEFLDVAFTHIR